MQASERADAVAFCERLRPRLVGALTLYSGDSALRLLGAESDAAPAVQVGDPTGIGLTVLAQPCRSDTRWVSGTAEEAEAGVCRPGWGVTVRVHGPRDLVDSVRGSIDVRRLT